MAVDGSWLNPDEAKAGLRFTERLGQNLGPQGLFLSGGRCSSRHAVGQGPLCSATLGRVAGQALSGERTAPGRVLRSPGGRGVCSELWCLPLSVV